MAITLSWNYATDIFLRKKAGDLSWTRDAFQEHFKKADSIQLKCDQNLFIYVDDKENVMLQTAVQLASEINGNQLFNAKIKEVFDSLLAPLGKALKGFSITGSGAITICPQPSACKLVNGYFWVHNYNGGVIIEAAKKQEEGKEGA